MNKLCLSATLVCSPAVGGGQEEGMPLPEALLDPLRARAQSEARRLAALDRTGLLDSPPEPRFDALVAQAAERLGVPIALISLVDADRQWFKARVGIAAEETPRAVAFCHHTIRGGDLMVIPDATQDRRFAENPLVTGDPSIRFYAGAPVSAPDGAPIGTLCVIDRAPRPGLTEEEAAALRGLAAAVTAEIARRDRG